MKDIRFHEEEKTRKLAEDILGGIKSGVIDSRQTLEKFKKKGCKKYGLSRMPTNTDILFYMPEVERGRVESILKKKPVRTLSGVAVVAVMTSPHECPHGRCIPCPGGPPFSAQSYTGKEPAAQRAIMHDYDPFEQTADRIKQIEIVGHPADKIELILMGGTFTARDFLYQEWFVGS